LENEKLKNQSKEGMQPAGLAYRHQIFHIVDNREYLDEPQWEPGEGAQPVLRATNSVRNINYYLDQHPEIAFAIYKVYDSRPRELSELETNDGVFRRPEPTKEILVFIADSMVEAVEEVIRQVPEFDKYFPSFNPEKKIPAPYLFMFYSQPFLPDILPELQTLSRTLMEKLSNYIDQSYGLEYEFARSSAAKKCVSSQLLKYLIQPGDILVDPTDPSPQAFIALDWAKEVTHMHEDEDENDNYDRSRRKHRSKLDSGNVQKSIRYSWTVSVTFWGFDGAFKLHKGYQTIHMKVGYKGEIIPISQLNIVPLKYAPQHLEGMLMKRGCTFWKLRFRRFVTYHGDEYGELNSVRIIQFPMSHIFTTQWPLICFRLRRDT
jgi:chemotaxis signal transduction protein